MKQPWWLDFQSASDQQPDLELEAAEDLAFALESESWFAHV